MPIQQTRGTVRASKGYAVFRIVFGLLFLGLGVNQYSRYPAGSQLPYFSLGIGALFIAYGLFALFAAKTLGTRIDLETSSASATERLAGLTRLKVSGAISEQEFETKRQEILKTL